MSNSLLNYASLVEVLRCSDERKDTLEKYERYFGSQQGANIGDTEFYRSYLSKFRFDFFVVTPEECGDRYDWDLLFRLIAGSLYSDYTLSITDFWKKNPTAPLTVEVYIHIMSLTKILSELSDTQIFRLFEIYISEQMALSVFIKEEECEEDSDDYNDDFFSGEDGHVSVTKDRRNCKLKKFNDKLQRLKNETELYTLKKLKTMKMFDFQSYINELRNDPEKMESVEIYEKHVETLDGKDIKDTVFYKNYLSKFNMDYTLQVPDELYDDFDWDLLVRLVAASYSSSYLLRLSDNWKCNPVRQAAEAEMVIRVASGSEVVLKILHEMCEFQILRLFEIYVNEQIDITIIKEKADNEDDFFENNDNYAIQNERNMRIKKFNGMMEAVKEDACNYLAFEDFIQSKK